MHTKLVLIHIPKTAGSSARSTLAYGLANAHGPDRKIIGIDVPDPDMGYFDGLASAAARRLPELFQDGLRIMSGHYRYRDIAAALHEDRTRVSLISFLRDPVRRTLSDYHYSSSERHAGHAAFVAMYPSFEDYVRNPGEMNKQVDYLRPFDGAPLDVTIESALNTLDFIGLTETFDADMHHLIDTLKVDVARLETQNVNPDTATANAAFERYNDMLQDLLAPDIALYEAIANRRRHATAPPAADSTT